MSDFDLLQEYASQRSEEAFRTLVGRYANLVFSAALRQTRDPHAAEDVAQAVFIILARKAGALPRTTVLCGWLLRTARFVALNALRRQAHRRQTEEEAMSLYTTEGDAAWDRIAPVLDEALLGLGNRDRDAIALRFFEQKTFREIAEKVGTSEDNAQKRVSRAIGKLRAGFARRGVVVPSALVASAITTRAVHAAPGHLVVSVTSAATSGAAAGGSISTLAKAALGALERARCRALALRGAGVLLMLLMALLVLHQFKLGRLPPPAGRLRLATEQPATQPAAAAPVAVASLASGTQGLMRLRVMDAQTETPVPRARITSYWSAELPDFRTAVLATDDRGECLISFGPGSEEDWLLLVRVIADGYVPRFVRWAGARGDLDGHLPAEHGLRLVHGLAVGGTVVNERGEAVPDAQVSFEGVRLPPADGYGELEGQALAHTETTDAQGRWLCSHLPPEVEVLRFSISHPDYLSAAFDESRPAAAIELGWQRLGRDDFRKQAALTVLKPGLVVAGFVKDQQAQPIAGAKVTERRARDDDLLHQETTRPTGTDGRFRFGDVTQEDVALCVQADGFAGKRIVVHPAPETAEVVIELAHAGVLRGRVVDEDARPVVHAHLDIVGGGFEQNEIGWLTTDDEGRFSWLSVPPSHERYSVSASGYARATNLVLAPDGTEHIIKLRKVAKPRRFRISGSVIDRATRDPISAFEVWVAPTLRHVRSGLPVEYPLGKTLFTTGNNGKFFFLEPKAYSAPVVSYSVEIEADGYRSATLTASGPLTNGDCQLNFRLEAAPTVYATVQMPDGQPAVGAMVLLCGNDEDIAYMRRPAQLDLTISKGSRAKTDIKGAFILTVTRPATTACIAHPGGYAQLPLEELTASRAVRLQAWGRITGSLKVGSRVGANERIWLNNSPSSKPGPLNAGLTTTADADGRFTIEGLPPGRWELSHQPKPAVPRAGGPVRADPVSQLRAVAIPLSQKMEVSVKPGVTTQVALGGAGRKVVGKAKANVPDRRIYFRGELLGLTQSSAGRHSRQAEPIPSEAAVPPEGPRDLRQYFLVFDSDGTFCIDDVLPGSYELKILAWDQRPDDSPLALGEPFAPVVLEATVPEAGSGESAPFDLGVLELDLKRLWPQY